jgi:hypothetical protein
MYGIEMRTEVAKMWSEVEGHFRTFPIFLMDLSTSYSCKKN